jgi:hypothetical protein
VSCERFGLRAHVRGLVLSQLSNQRPWKPIAENLHRIQRIFFDYDPDTLQQADPRSLANDVRAIRCGNRAILEQMNALASNIATFRRIEGDYGSLDKFVTSSDPFGIAKLISVRVSPQRRRSCCQARCARSSHSGRRKACVFPRKANRAGCSPTRRRSRKSSRLQRDVS